MNPANSQIESQADSKKRQTDSSPEDPHKHALKFLILSNVAISFTYSMLAAIYPIANEDQGLAQYYSGIVIAVYPVSYGLATLVSKRISKRMGLKALIALSFTVLEISLVGLGLVFFFTRYVFYALSIVASVVQGAAVGLIDVSVRTYAQSLYRNLETSTGYLRAAILVGFLLGPTLGSMFYHWTSYTVVMILWAVILFGFNVLLMKYLRSIVQLERQTHKSLWPAFKKSIIDSRIISSLLILLSTTIAMTLLLTSIGPRLWNLGQDNIALGVFLVAVTITPAITALVYKKVPPAFDRRLIIIIAGFIIGIGSLIMAPLELYTYIINDSKSANVICMYIGGGKVGIGFTLLLLSSLVGLQDRLESINPRYGEDEILSLTAKLFKSLSLVGFIIGPLLGGFLIDKYSFQKVVQWMGVGIIVVSVLFLVLCGYIQDKAFKSKYQQEKYEDIKDGEPEDPQAASLLHNTATVDERLDLTAV